MKRLLTILILFVSLHITGWAMEHGVPFIKNFPASVYNAHNRNYDVVCDNYGTVFVANFEGLLYYDRATWRKILTPGVSRITKLAKGPDGRIWIGGYNVFGYLVSDLQGRLQINYLLSDANSKIHSEVDQIKAVGKEIYMHTTQGMTYHVLNGKSLELVKHGGDRIFHQVADSLRSIRMTDGVRVGYSPSSGIQFILPDNSRMHLTESDGLISNNISNVAFDGRHSLWAATARGVFCTEVATPFSRITEEEGLKGSVNVVNELGNTVYIGAQNGLYILKDGRIRPVPEITLGCWNLINNGHGELIAPTSQGLFIISKNGLRKITSNTTLSVCLDKATGDYITGEIDGIYRVSASGKHTRIASIEKVTSIIADGDRMLLTTIYESLWQIPSRIGSHIQEKCLRKNADPKIPKVTYNDPMGRQWKTDSYGENVSVSGGRDTKKLSYWIHPLCDKALSTIHVCHDGTIMAGGDFGLIILDARLVNSIKIAKTERPYIRQIIAMGDSVIWGGYSQGTLCPMLDIDDIELPSSCHDVRVTFSASVPTLVSPNLFRYRVNGGKWSPWSQDAFVDFNNLAWGKTELEVQLRDLYGRVSDISSVTWKIAYPWYLRWWAMLFYLAVLIYVITIFFRWRERRLQREKDKLESVVAKRTSELSEAYDKQQKISSELSDTLDDLKRTQDDLVRMERTATAGKLTQGLIDRILNPINYINNFSKLTSGLAKDLREDIEDEQGHMSEDNYEDCEDILDMMNQNLSKIEEHGVNTTRTLRAMEAMLNNHVGALISQDIRPLCRQVVEVTIGHFKSEISRCGINVHAVVPEQPVMVEYDADSMNRVLISLLANSVYAVVKKYSQAQYANPEVSIAVAQTDQHAVITIHDNGIGIEDTIKEKVFDPFFTTKTTGEAAGVGLYLVRETINDHKGTVTLNSEKGEYCEFTITL